MDTNKSANARWPDSKAPSANMMAETRISAVVVGGPLRHEKELAGPPPFELNVQQKLLVYLQSSVLWTAIRTGDLRLQQGVGVGGGSGGAMPAMKPEMAHGALTKYNSTRDNL